MKQVNPFLEKTSNIESSYQNWEELNSKPYNKLETPAYTKTRVILMNGNEFEANAFMHQFARHCDNNDLRREMAIIRRREQQQQKLISALKPFDENILETTIAYEQLAVDLTACLAKHVKDKHVKEALDFALLEDFDHLYRFSNLLNMEYDIKAKSLVNEYTELTPGRPLICEHRFPTDDVKRHINSKEADPFTKLTTNIITAAEQQTMNYYMNIANQYPTELGRKMFSEIAMIEEQHVSSYESLIDTNLTWLENWLMHEYTEAYLYYSCYEDESVPYIKNIWYQLYLEECSHLQHVAKLCEKYENKNWKEMFPDGGAFPQLITLSENIDYIKDVLKNTIEYTADQEGYCDINKMPKDAKFFVYNKQVNGDLEKESGHVVIKQHIENFGQDYRFEVSKNPVPSLQDRQKDNIDIGRIPRK